MDLATRASSCPNTLQVLGMYDAAPPGQRVIPGLEFAGRSSLRRPCICTQHVHATDAQTHARTPSLLPARPPPPPPGVVEEIGREPRRKISKIARSADGKRNVVLDARPGSDAAPAVRHPRLLPTLLFLLHKRLGPSTCSHQPLSPIASASQRHAS